MSTPLNTKKVSEVQKRVNERHRELFIEDGKGGWMGFVCTCCDRCVMKSDE
jgi:hypothetical protein